MRLTAAILLPVLLLGIGCSNSEPVSVLKPESEKVHVGMQAEEVKAICGEPKMNFTDPLSGSAMWMYKDETTGEHMNVSFNMEGVSKVTYGKG